MKNVYGEKFIVDKNGRRTAVVININKYLKMLKLLKEAEILKIIKEGEKEYIEGKLKPIRSLSELK